MQLSFTGYATIVVCGGGALILIVNLGYRRGAYEIGNYANLLSSREVATSAILKKNRFYLFCLKRSVAD